jgi:hypothetical protein
LADCHGSLDLGHNVRGIDPVGTTIVVTQGADAAVVPLHLNGYTGADGVLLSCAHDAGSGVTIGCTMAAGSSTNGALTLRADGLRPDGSLGASQPGDYHVLVTASVSGSFAPPVTQSIAFTVAVGVGFSLKTDTTLGKGGRFDEFMGTAFQPADWQAGFFTMLPDKSPLLQALAPHHILIQVMDGGAIPLKKSSQGTLSWNFTELDAIVKNVLDVSALNPIPDSGPELQIAVAPNITEMIDPATGLVDNDAFATYCASLVAYYNVGSFKDPYGGAQTIVNPNVRPIRWWGIWSDYNVGNNALEATKYTQLYNTAAKAMLAVDNRIAFSALEFNENSGSRGNPSQDIGTFVSQVDPAAPVGAASLHFYATDDPTTTDADVFAAIQRLVRDVGVVYGALGQKPALAGVPVWITQNNVNSDAPDSSGQSTANSSNPFRDDPRGTGAFFAAWRPYLFSAAGKAKNRGLFHWEYTGGQCGARTAYCQDPQPSSDTDVQSAEVNYTTGQPYLSYWVDYELGHMFPSPPGEDILLSTVTEPNEVEVLATQRDDGSVVVMVVDRAVDDTTDGGAGVPLTVVVDASALVAAGGFSKVSTVMLDAATPTDTEPVAANRALADGRIPVVFSRGYGTAFLVFDRAP